MGGVCDVARAAVTEAWYRASTVYHATGRSKVKGLGLEYVDLRDYEYGDDVRFVEWRASARSPSPWGEHRLLVKEFEAEHRLDVILGLDLSSSMSFRSKPYLLVYAATLILLVADRLGDRVTLVPLSRREVVRPPRPRSAISVVLSWVCGDGLGGEASLGRLREFYGRPTRTPLILVTDYDHDPGEAYRLLRAVRASGSTALTVTVVDEAEAGMPVDALAGIVDAERGWLAPARLSEVYESLKKHVRTMRAILGANSIHIEFARPAAQAPRLISHYLAARQGLRVGATSMQGWRP